MKKIIIATLVLTGILLLITILPYIEWIEVFIIIGSLSIISIIYNLFFKDNQKIGKVIISSAIIGFLFSYIFSLFDLVVDHHKVIQGVPDGRFLTLSETISEFSDDLFIIALIVMVAVTLITYASTTITSKSKGKWHIT
jgi:ABC-type Fe3+-siderophore transport system permease subunit